MSISIMFLFIFHTVLYFTLPLRPTFYWTEIPLPLDVLPLYKKVSNLHECEGLQGDLGAPRGGQKIPADVTRASANRAAASVGGAGLCGGTGEGTKKTLTPGCATIRWHDKRGAERAQRVRLAPCTVISIRPLRALRCHLAGRSLGAGAGASGGTGPAGCQVWGVMLTEHGLGANSPHR